MIVRELIFAKAIKKIGGLILMSKKIRGLMVFVLLAMLAILGACNQESDKSQVAAGEKDVTLDYPTKPIKIINPFSAGGSADSTSRILGQHAEQYLGKSVVIENRDGGGGTIGQTAGAKAKNDGYTLTLMTSSLVGNTIYNDVSFEVDDFEPIIMVVNDPIYLVIGKDQPFDDIESFLKYAKENPGDITVGVNGTQTVPAIVNKQLAVVGEFEVSTIPFDGESLALAALAGGHVQAMYGSYSGFESQLDSGNVKAILISGEERSENLPDVPTAKESGIDVAVGSWRGIGAPKGTDPEIIKFLHDAFKETFENEEFQDQMKKVGIDVSYEGTEGFKEVIKQMNQTYLDYGE